MFCSPSLWAQENPVQPHGERAHLHHQRPPRNFKDKNTPGCYSKCFIANSLARNEYRTLLPLRYPVRKLWTILTPYESSDLLPTSYWVWNSTKSHLSQPRRQPHFASNIQQAQLLSHFDCFHPKSLISKKVQHDIHPQTHH